MRIHTERGFVFIWRICFSGNESLPKEQQDCGKQKRKADGQQKEVFMQIALCIQIFGGKCLCNQAENAAKQDGCADIGKVTHHPVFCCVHNKDPF